MKKLERRIKDLKNKLNLLVEKDPDELTKEEILKVSKELDNLIVKEQRNRLRTIA